MNNLVIRDFKPIRNKIRNYSYDSLTIHLLDILKEQERNEGPTPFWHALLLLKWTLEFAGESYPPRHAERKDIYKLISMLEALELSHDTFNLKRNGRMSKTFTILAYQQFEYQDKPWFDTFARQLILFSELKCRYNIEESFKAKTGLSIKDILTALNILWIAVVNSHISKMPYNGVLTEDHDALFDRYLGEKSKNALYTLFTVSKENIKEVLESDPRVIRNYNLQIFETSFFTRRPFLFFRNIFIIPHRDVLNHTINHFIYEFMKNRDDLFSEELGSRMEKYLEIGLRENQIRFVSEKVLRDKLGRDSKVVDFIIEDNILLEAKAIELRPITSINPTDQNLALELAKNVVKAYAQQMLFVANQLGACDKYFGIIITYKKLHLGDSMDIWEQFLRDETLKIIGDEKKLDALPIRNLFFIDLKTWDLIMQIVKTKKATIKEILLRVNDAEKKEGKKFGLYMHLDSYEIKQYDLNYLSKQLI